MTNLTLTAVLETELNKLNLDVLDTECNSWAARYNHDEGHVNIVIAKHDKHENLVSVFVRYNNKYACSVVCDYKSFQDKHGFIRFVSDEIYAQTEMKLEYSPDFQGYLDGYYQ